MKILKILGGIVGALGVSLFVFWFGWYRVPDKGEVCTNIRKVYKLDESMFSQETCVLELRTPAFGHLKFVKKLKCLRDAETQNELAGCDESFAVGKPTGR